MSSLQWVKVHVGLLHNPRFKKLSSEARWTFVACLIIAGDLGGDAELVIQGWGPMTAVDIAGHTGYPEKRQHLALAELLHIGFLTKSERGAFTIAQWDEKAGDESRREAARLRKQAQRDRERDSRTNVTPVTRDVTPGACDVSHQNVTDIEKEIEGELSSSLRSEASGGQNQPPKRRRPEPDTSWVEPLREAASGLRGRQVASFTPDDCVLAGRYHAWAFGNCTRTEARNKARGVEIAGAFAAMGRNPKYGDITFGEYVSYARKVHERREKTPFFDPWLIRAFVEFNVVKAS